MTLDSLTRPEAISELASALAAGAQAAWSLLFAHLAAGGTAPSEPLVRALLVVEPEPLVWLDLASEAARSARNEWGSQPTRAAIPWLLAGFAEALEPDHPAALRARFEMTRNENVPFEGLIEFEALVRRSVVDTDLHFDVLLANTDAFGAGRRTEDALGFASEARRVGERLGDPELASIAQRAFGATLLRAGRVREAFSVLAPVMQNRVGPFGGTTFSRSFDAPTELELARDEAAHVAMWASQTAAEWARALGVLAERSETASDANMLWGAYASALLALRHASKRPESALEAIIRQAEQRGCPKAAEAAVASLEALEQERGRGNEA